MPAWSSSGQRDSRDRAATGRWASPRGAGPQITQKGLLHWLTEMHERKRDLGRAADGTRDGSGEGLLETEGTFPTAREGRQPVSAAPNTLHSGSIVSHVQRASEGRGRGAEGPRGEDTAGDHGWISIRIRNTGARWKGRLKAGRLAGQTLQ